jgi:hypothetical protein
MKGAYSHQSDQMLLPYSTMVDQNPRSHGPSFSATKGPLLVPYPHSDTHTFGPLRLPVMLGSIHAEHSFTFYIINDVTSHNYIISYPLIQLTR